MSLDDIAAQVLGLETSAQRKLDASTKAVIAQNKGATPSLPSAASALDGAVSADVVSFRDVVRVAAAKQLAAATGLTVTPSGTVDSDRGVKAAAYYVKAWTKAMPTAYGGGGGMSGGGGSTESWDDAIELARVDALPSLARVASFEVWHAWNDEHRRNVESLPGHIWSVQWIAFLDEHTCRVCKAMHLKFADANGQFMVGSPPTLQEDPPAHGDCLPPGTPIRTPEGTRSIESLRVGDYVIGGVSGLPRRVVEVHAPWCEGELVVVRAAGHTLRLTPNHPVLTQRGWIAAGDLVLTDHLFCEVEQPGIRQTDDVSGEPKDPPPGLDQGAILPDVDRRLVDRVVPVARVDFDRVHAVRNRDVDVPDIHDHLWDYDDVARQKGRNEQRLDVSRDGRGPGYRETTSLDSAVDTATRGSVGGASQSRATLDALATHAEKVGRAPALDREAHQFQVTEERRTRDAAATRDGEQREVLVHVEPSKLGDINSDAVSSSRLNPETPARLCESLPKARAPHGLGSAAVAPDEPVRTDASGARVAFAHQQPPEPPPRQIDDIHAHTVLSMSRAVINIDAISREPYSGPTHNIGVETDESYLAEGLVVHNCRCFLKFDVVGTLPAKAQRGPTRSPPKATMTYAIDSIGHAQRDEMVRRDDALRVRAIRVDARECDFIASTETLDSYEEIVDQATWDLSAFKANPVVLYSHDRSELPIGKATRCEVVNGQLECTIRFATAEANPEAEKVWRLVQEEVLRAVSVGFRAGEGRYETRGKRDVYVLYKNKLKEISIVPIPANEDCLAQMKAASLAELGVCTIVAGREVEMMRQNASDPDVRERIRSAIALRDAAPTKITPELPAPSLNLNDGANSAATEKEKMDLKEATEKLETTTKTLAEAGTRIKALETDNSALTSANATLTKEHAKAATDRDAAIARAEKAESAQIEIEVDALVGKKIAAVEKADFVALRKSNPELFASMIAKRADMKLGERVIPAGTDENGGKTKSVDPVAQSDTGDILAEVQKSVGL